MHLSVLLLSSLLLLVTSFARADSNIAIDSSKLSVVVICNSRLRRCLPPTLGTEIEDILYNTPQVKIFVAFSDLRSGQAARELMTRNPPASSATKQTRTFQQRGAIAVPCDITVFGGAPSILSCIADAAVAHSLAEDHLLLFIGGAAISIPDTALSQLAESLSSNRLAAVSSVAVVRGGMLNAGGNSNSAVQQGASIGAEDDLLVFNAGYSRLPPHRSVLGGVQGTVARDQLGVDARDEKLRDLRSVDSIDFAAVSLVTAQAFLQGSVHPPPKHTRAFEWCPTSMDEIMWLADFLSKAIDNADSDTDINEEGSGVNLSAAAAELRRLPVSKQRQVERQVRRSLAWLESLDADACNVRSRPGVRFDAMFESPVSPAMQFGGPLGIVQHGESAPTIAESLLQRLSSVLNDALVTSQIIYAMESVTALGNTMAALPKVQVLVDSTPSLSTMSFPSRISSTTTARELANQAGNQNGNNAGKGQQPAYPLVVVWDVYCCRCCGFSSEIELLISDLKKCTVYLTAHVNCFCSGQREGERMALESRFVTVERLAAHPATDVTVFISHSQPFLFQSFWLEQHSCDYRIARTMLEASRIPDDWTVALKNSVNEVWVTSQQQKQMFINSGVPASKIFAIPESVDTDRLDPDGVEPFSDIDQAAHDYGWNMHCTRSRQGKQKRRRGGAAAAANKQQQQHDDKTQQGEQQAEHYIFFGNFKWEERKSPGTLLTAYFDAFFDRDKQQPREDVSLYILTSAFMDKSNPRNHLPIMQLLDQWAQAKFPDQVGPSSASSTEEQDDENSKHSSKNNKKKFDLKNPSRAFAYWHAHTPRVCLIVDLLPDDQMDRLYASADAFVLATRGEGWGLPVIQSMALAMPVITTGAEMVPFITDPSVAYLIDLDGMEQGDSDTAGAKWAIPSISHLTELLRHVLSHRDEAAEVGKRGREYVVRHYSVRTVSAIIERRLMIIANFVSSLYRN